jgi:hypothetical protein
MATQFKTDLIKSVSAIVGAGYDDKIIDYYNSINKEQLKGIEYKRAFSILTNTISEKILDERKHAIVLPPKIPSSRPKYNHHYISLDTAHRFVDGGGGSGNIKKFNWKFAHTRGLVGGFFNVTSENLGNIVAMRIYQPRIPYVASMDTNAKRVSILIEEFSSQSFIAEGRRFHFILRPDFLTSDGTYIECSSEREEENVFEFATPITEVNSLTLSFGNPYTTIEFPSSFPRFMINLEFISLVGIH